MKSFIGKIIIYMIRLYQRVSFYGSGLWTGLFIQPQCRFSPSCSEYACIMVERYGPIYGIIRAIRRILSCNPLSKKPLIDMD